MGGDTFVPPVSEGAGGLWFQIFVATLYLTHCEHCADEHCGESTAEDGEDLATQYGRLSLCGKVSKFEMRMMR